MGKSTRPTQILYASAVDKDGVLVHVGEAAKGGEYFCPVCNSKLILRRSGKTGKGSRRPHFAHNELTANCTPEGVLHLSFKRMLIEYLNRCIVEQVPFVITWTCQSCNQSCQGNLLDRVTYIREEVSLGPCRPDVALFNSSGFVLVAIEIVVTHAPEQTAIQHYRDNGIVLVQVDLESEADLLIVDEIARERSVIDYCTNIECPEADRRDVNRRVLVHQSRCEACMSPVEKYSVEIDTVFGKQTAPGFTDSEIEYVKSRQTNIQVRAGVGERGRIPVFICSNCKRLRSKYNRPRL